MKKYVIDSVEQPKFDRDAIRANNEYLKFTELHSNIFVMDKDGDTDHVIYGKTECISNDILEELDCITKKYEQGLHNTELDALAIMEARDAMCYVVLEKWNVHFKAVVLSNMHLIVDAMRNMQIFPADVVKSISSILFDFDPIAISIGILEPAINATIHSIEELDEDSMNDGLLHIVSALSDCISTKLFSKIQSISSGIISKAQLQVCKNDYSVDQHDTTALYLQLSGIVASVMESLMEVCSSDADAIAYDIINVTLSWMPGVKIKEED